ncbi:MAG: glycosyltransferase family 4 protein [Elusimicrobiota bacterium]
MKVLMQNRYDALVNKGGDSYQMLYTKKYLEEYKIKVDVSTDLRPDVSGYDIIHLYNITRVHETYAQFLNAKKQNKKVVISPIYHSMADIKNYEAKNLTGIHSFLVNILRSTDSIQLLKTLNYVYKHPNTWFSWFLQASKGYTAQQKEILDGTDYIIPNSDMETKAIIAEVTGPLRARCKVVHNGIDETIAGGSSRIQDWIKRIDIKDFVICAGRIEPRKNVLTLADILSNTGIPVVFAGRTNTMHSSYAGAFFRKIQNSSNLYYIPEVNQEEVMTLYKHAKVCVLASWFETTGLAGLEAGINGCNVVMTEKGYTREYYKDRAWYCDPENPESIRDAVISAHKALRNDKDMPRHIRDMGFFWKNSAARTLECYKEVLRS